MRASNSAGSRILPETSRHSAAQLRTAALAQSSALRSGCRGSRRNSGRRCCKFSSRLSSRTPFIVIQDHRHRRPRHIFFLSRTTRNGAPSGPPHKGAASTCFASRSSVRREPLRSGRFGFLIRSDDTSVRIEVIGGDLPQRRDVLLQGRRDCHRLGQYPSRRSASVHDRDCAIASRTSACSNLVPCVSVDRIVLRPCRQKLLELGRPGLEPGWLASKASRLNRVSRLPPWAPSR